VTDRTLAFDLRVRFRGFDLAAAAAIPLAGITALSGPSGSGKTTLLRALAGLEQAAEGQVRFAGADWRRLAPGARRIGYVFQDARLFPHLDVAGNLAYGARRRGTPAERVARVVAALDLGPLMHRRTETLSGGEARRVALGRALAADPQVLFLDEPLTGLDRARKSALMPYIARASAAFGIPALYVTHSAGEIAFLADRVLGIAAGRLTGWRPAAPRLAAQVVKTGPDTVCLAVAGRRVWVPGSARPGERWAIPLGDDYVLSAAPPGASTAALVLEGRVQGAGPAGLDVVFADQSLTLTWAGPAPAPVSGAPIWLTLPRAVGRVVAGG